MPCYLDYDPADEDRKEITRLTRENETLKARLWELVMGPQPQSAHLLSAHNQAIYNLKVQIRRNEDQIRALDDNIAHVEHYGVPHPGN